VIETEFFPLDVTDFGPSISKIQAAKPDLVMSILVGGAHISFYRQWYASGMKGEIPMASTTFGGGNEHIILTPEEANGIIYACGYFQELDTPASNAFRERLVAKFGEDHAYMSELPCDNYEGVHIWAKAVEMAGTTDRMPVIEALESGLSFAGPSGEVIVDKATHHATRTALLAQCQNRGFSLLEEYPLQPPADTQAVCDLVANPNDNQHYVISVD